MAGKQDTPKQYDESSFRVLKGLEPVRERPGMYTRTDSPAHIIQEVIDNAADEALGGFAKKIHVTLHLDGSVTIADDGRGIPVGLHPDEGVPVVVLAFTRLHAGGKFDKREGNSAYAFSGGLHGVGVSVTNALSTRIEVEVKRDGKIHRIDFADGGETISPVRVEGDCGRQTGTRVRVWPDGKYFESPRVPMNELERLLRSKAVLLSGVAVRLDIEQASGPALTKTWSYPEGLAGYLKELAGDVEAVAPIFTADKYAGKDDPTFAPGEGAAWALAWFESAVPSESYVNLIPTVNGGTHESGLRAGVFEAMKSFIDHHTLLPRGVKLQQEDVCGRMSFVLSARLLDPQFQGQVKEKLNSREAVKLVSSQLRDPFEIWLNNHVEAGKRHRRAVDQAGAGTPEERAEGREEEDLGRRRAARQAVGLRVRGPRRQRALPGRGRLRRRLGQDGAQQGDPGHPAAARQGAERLGDRPRPPVRQRRDPRHRGGARRGRAQGRQRRGPLRPALRQGRHHVRRRRGRRPHPDPAADPVLPPLPQADRARPRVCGAAAAVPRRRARPRQEAPAAPALRARRGRARAIRDRLEKEGFKPDAIEIGRFKGLGEMNPDQLRETTMDPATRRVLPVKVRSGALQDTLKMFTLLMGKGEASGRRAWMEEKGDSVEADI
jgi:topoisomerase-4 subunit B